MRILKKSFFLLLIIFTLQSIAIAQDSNTGQLLIDVNLPKPFYLVNGIDLLNAIKVDSGEVIDLSAGLYTFTIVSEFVDNHSFKVQIIPGEQIDYFYRFTVFRIGYRSSFVQLENQENLVINTDIDSEIFLDGKKIGKHYASLLVKPGIYEIETVHPTFGKLKDKIEVNWYETTDFARFNEPQVTNASAINYMPGASYLINGEKDKAIFTYFTMSILVGSYFSLDRKIREQSPIFDITKLERMQTASLIGLGVVYVLSTIDGARKPRNGYPGDNSKLELTSLGLNQNLGPSAGFRINF